jgi:dCMP deaminase
VEENGIAANAVHVGHVSTERGSEMRPSWDQTWLTVADTVAQRSLCVRAKVGAVIVDPTHQYVVTGYNGPPAGYRHGSQPCSVWCQRTTSLKPAPDYTDCYTIHAEANALLKSDYTRREGGTIYVTSHICWGCAKLIANSGLSRVVVDGDSPAAHRDPIASYRFLQECGIQVVLTDLVMQDRISVAAVPETLYQFADDATRRERMPNPRIGMVTWQTDTNRAEIFNGTEWVQR